MRRVAVGNLEADVEAMKRAVDEAGLMAGVEVDSVYIAISGPHIKGCNSRGVIAVAGKNREITRDDVRLDGHDSVVGGADRQADAEQDPDLQGRTE